MNVSRDEEGRLMYQNNCVVVNQVNVTDDSQFYNVLDADFEPITAARQRNTNQIVSIQGIKFDLAHSRSCPMTEPSDCDTEKYSSLLRFLRILDFNGLLGEDS